MTQEKLGLFFGDEHLRAECSFRLGCADKQTALPGNRKNDTVVIGVRYQQSVISKLVGKRQEYVYPLTQPDTACGIRRDQLPDAVRTRASRIDKSFGSDREQLLRLP